MKTIFGIIFLITIGMTGWWFGFFDFVPKIGTPFGDFVKNKSGEQSAVVIIPTDPIDIADIIERIENGKTDEEVQDLLDIYKDTLVMGDGKYSNKWRSNENEGPKIGIKVNGRTVKCNFNPDWQKRIELSQLGDTINFLGTFRFIESWGRYYVEDCSLTK
ncbi:MAG: hypothetical protein HYY55_00390 [Candidatus Niyogibacteria bacterium]|nr:MAG: hypothetical protein HYY55_00390 [Candidatus Niyogibacteria bacterium]